MKKSLIIAIVLTSFSYSSTNITVSTLNIVKGVIYPYKVGYRTYKFLELQKKKYDIMKKNKEQKWKKQY